MSTTALVTGQSETATATTSTKPQVIWQARAWEFLINKDLHAVRCASSQFKFILPLHKMKTAMDCALYYQSQTSQALQSAKILLDWDFTFQGTTKHQSPIAFHKKDPLSKALDCSLTTYNLLEDAIASTKTENMQGQAALNESTQAASSPEALPEGKTSGNLPSFLEEVETSLPTPENEITRAFHNQVRSCQFLETAVQALEEMTRTNYYIDFRLEGASKSQPLPSNLTAQKAELIFHSPYKIDEDFYAQTSDDALEVTLRSGYTAYKFIELAIAGRKGENREAEGDEGDIEDPNIEAQTPADQPYFSEEEGDEQENPNRTALRFHFHQTSSTSPSTPSLHFLLNPPEETPDSVAKRLAFTSLSPPEDFSTPAPVYPHPAERPPYPLWNPEPPSDPRWKEAIMKDQESPKVDPLALAFATPLPSKPEPNSEDETF